MKNQKEQKIRCKTKAVRSQRIAWMLRNEGFPVINIRPNRCMPNLNVFIFEATPELCAALNEHIKTKITYGISRNKKRVGGKNHYE